MCPDLGHTRVEGREADLQIGDARPADTELVRNLQAARHKGGRRRKDGRPGGFDQRFNEPSGNGRTVEPK